MRGRGSIVWVVVPFNGARDESKVGRSFDFLSPSSSLNRIFHSRFWFLSNRGDLVMSSVKVISMTSPFANMLARSSYVKTSRFLGRKTPRTHSYGSLWMTRRVLENELGRRRKRQTVVYMCRSRTLVTLRRLLLMRLDPRCRREIKLHLGFSESRCFGLFQWFVGKCKSSKGNTKIKMTADLTIV